MTTATEISCKNRGKRPGKPGFFVYLVMGSISAESKVRDRHQVLFFILQQKSPKLSPVSFFISQ